LKGELDQDVEPSVDGGIVTDWYLENNFKCTKEDLRDIYWNSHADKIMGDGWPWAGAIKKMYDTPQWKKTMAKNGLAPLDLSGKAFEGFVANSVASIQTISKQIGIIK